MFFYVFSFLLNPLCLPPLLFFFYSGLSHAFFFVPPNLVAFLFCSSMGHRSVCSGTGVQLWLCGRQLLPCHWRPSHWPSAKALSDLDMRTAQTRALLYCQSPAGEASLANECVVSCILLLLLADQRGLPRRLHILLSIQIGSTTSRGALGLSQFTLSSQSPFAQSHPPNISRHLTPTSVGEVGGCR